MTNSEKDIRTKTLKWICDNLLFCQKIPPALSKKVKALMFDEQGEQVYTYEMILYTAIKYANNIQYAFQNKDFQTQGHKINYIIAVIANNIDNIKRKVVEYKREQTNVENQLQETQKLADNNVLFGRDRYIKKTQNIVRKDLQDLWQTQD